MSDFEFVPDPFFRGFDFHAVMDWPKDYDVYDFTRGYDGGRSRRNEFGIGRYNEDRVGMYTSELFDPGSASARTIHMGIDLAAPIGTPVYACYTGSVYMTAINESAGDYGGTVIIEHRLRDRKLWSLYGHLSHRSVSYRKIGSSVAGGEVVGWLGAPHENGGWNPHLHLQFSWEMPLVCDMPGAVSKTDREAALKRYPDPRNVLGQLY